MYWSQRDAEKYASKKGFERKTMLTDRAKQHYRKRVKEVREQELKPYDGHDTVGEVALDCAGKIVAGTSTSGLFMKKAGVLGILLSLVVVSMQTLKLVELLQQVLGKI